MTLQGPKTFPRPIALKADKTLEPDTDILERICEYEKPAEHLLGTGSFRLPQEALAKYAGTYEFGPGREAVVAVDGQTLALHLSAADTHVLVAQSDTTFISTGFGEPVGFAKHSGRALIS